MWLRAAVVMGVLAFAQVGWLRADEKVVESVVSQTESVAVKYLNEAGVGALVKVVGIGKVTAKAIISYRDKKGEFKALEDLLKVTTEDGKPVFAGTAKKPGKRFIKTCTALKELAKVKS